MKIKKDIQYYRFSLYGFLKNLRFFEAFLILFFLNKHISYLQIGSLYALRELTVNLFEIPSGIIADTLGKKKTLIFSFLIYIFSFICFYLGSKYIMFSIAMVLYALGDAARSGINKAMIVEYLKRTDQSSLKINYYGHTRSWSQFGSAISSLIGGILYFWQKNINIIFLFSIVPYLIDMINILLYPDFLDKTSKNHDPLKNRYLSVIHQFVYSFKNPLLRKDILNVSLYTGFYKSIKDFIQPFLKTLIIQIPILMYLSKQEKTALFVGFTYFFIFLFNSFASRNAEKFTKIFGSAAKFLNYSLLIGGVLGIITGLMMKITSSAWAIPIFLILLFIENARKPSGVAFITGHSDAKVHTGVLSVTSQLSSIVASLFVLIIGIFADSFGIGIGIFFVSFLIIIVLPLVKVKES